jgi:hypothetical protein
LGEAVGELVTGAGVGLSVAAAVGLGVGSGTGAGVAFVGWGVGSGTGACSYCNVCSKSHKCELMVIYIIIIKIIAARQIMHRINRGVVHLLHHRQHGLPRPKGILGGVGTWPSWWWFMGEDDETR